MGRDYIPEDDARAALWMRAFVNGLAAAPGKYAVSLPDVEMLESAISGFERALAVARKPETRTSSTVLAKCEARNSAQQVCRLFAGLIKLNQGIRNEDKNAIGVPPLHGVRSKRPAPNTSPALNVVAATAGCAHTLTFADSISGTRKLPFGVTQLQVFVAIGDETIADPDQARLCACCTRSPFVVTHEYTDARKIATYFARWVSQRGEWGPWSAPKSMCIAA